MSKSTLKEKPRNFRPLPHQIQALKRLSRLNPNLNVSELLRRGLELAIIDEAERLGKEAPHRGEIGVASALERAERAMNASKVSES